MASVTEMQINLKLQMDEVSIKLTTLQNQIKKIQDLTVAGAKTTNKAQLNQLQQIIDKYSELETKVKAVGSDKAMSSKDPAQLNTMKQTIEKLITSIDNLTKEVKESFQEQATTFKQAMEKIASLDAKQTKNKKIMLRRLLRLKRQS